MASAVHRASMFIVRSRDLVAEGLIEPNWKALTEAEADSGQLIEQKYRKFDVSDNIVEMTQPEKDAVDAAIEAALIADNRAAAVAAIDETEQDRGWVDRELIELHNKRDNYNTNRIVELQSVLVAVANAITASAGNAENIRIAVRAVIAGGSIPSDIFLATQTRPRSEAVQDYKDDINAGGVDT